MENYVQDKVIIITGASSGFGRITSEMAAEMGAKVICAARSEEKLIEVVKGIKDKGGTAEYIVTDVSDREQVNSMVKFAVEQFGRVDVLVNNAGIMPLAFFSDHDKAWKAWDKCIDINLKGVVYGISAVYDHMIEQGQGHIINISSIYGRNPVEGSAVYQATKIGVRFISETLRQEAQGKIKVTVLSPTGTAGTNLASEVVNMEAIKGALGGHYNQYLEETGLLMSGKGDPDWMNPDSIKYLALDAVSLSKNIIYCINQPWGVDISNITVRASGERYTI